MTASTIASAGAFDFLIGHWDIHNERLTSRLAGSQDWEQFASRAVCHGPLLQGGANLDEITFPATSSSGLTLRVLDPASGDWSLYWVSSTDGMLQPPMVGRFDENRRGEFYGDDSHNGVPIRCRFTWSGITANSARWEQAFSTDGGDTWEINWIMEYRRSG